jgi:hypothetical protein
MGLLDSLRAVLGLRAEADASRDADPEDLFGMSTAYLTMEAELGWASTGDAALCFADVDSTDFQDTVDEVKAILDAGGEDTGTEADFHEDSHGYNWVVLHDDTDPEDLVTSVHFAADTLVERDYGSRLLAAIFAFENTDVTDDDGDPTHAYWVYSFRRGAYYPFVPLGTNDRDNGIEFKLESALDGELDVEPDKEYWYPYWPSTAGDHPWT